MKTPIKKNQDNRQEIQYRLSPELEPKFYFSKNVKIPSTKGFNSCKSSNFLFGINGETKKDLLRKIKELKKRVSDINAEFS